MRSIRTYIGICCAGFLMLSGCAGSKSSTTTVTKAEDKATADTKVVEGGELIKVVIKQFSFTGVSPDGYSGIVDRFCSAVFNLKKFDDVVCAKDLKSFFTHKEDLIFLGECNEEDCLAKLGQRLNADYIIQCSISKVGETLIMSVNMFEGSTGKVKNRLSKDVPAEKPEDLLDVAVELAAKLIAEF